ncbi:hypothetical protein WA026_003209 [Henosepilachna vigintioctopunctata]|uniref:Uncharacterized protein n=1 Tax=Henosepilachna vigintioctopunctata TaxID=420089 RepID=A0AAW1TIM4_9CUCU
MLMRINISFYLEVTRSGNMPKWFIKGTKVKKTISNCLQTAPKNYWKMEFSEKDSRMKLVSTSRPLKVTICQNGLDKEQKSRKQLSIVSKRHRKSVGRWNLVKKIPE